MFTIFVYAVYERGGKREEEDSERGQRRDWGDIV
jgi:hypothetical protein